MAKDTEKLIRQLSLISYLMAERRPVTASEIRRDVEGYSGMNEDAFARRFYADRAELEALGIHLSVDKPAEANADQENYSLRPENFHLPAIEFSDQELAALGSALTLLDGEFAYAEPLRLALQQLTWGQPSPLNAPDQRQIALGVTAGAEGPELSQRLAKIETAIFRQKTILFDYFTIDRDETEKRKVDPYALLFQDGRFYLVGYAHEREAVRVFRLSRIRGRVSYASKSEHDFRRPADFDPRDYASRAAWQLGEPVGEAEIDVSKRIAWQIERHFDRYGEFEPSADGGRRFTTPYSSPRALISWVLRHGEHLRVAGPPELESELQDRIELLQRRHTPGGLELAATLPGAPSLADSEPEPKDKGEPTIRPERFARLVTLASILIQAGRKGETLQARELQQRLQITESELRDDVNLLSVVNFGGGSYVLYAEVGEDGTIEVDPEPYSDNFARPARLLPVEAKALVAAIDLIGDHLPEGALSTARQKIVDALGADPAQQGLHIAGTGGDDKDLARQVSTAIANGKVLKIVYWKPNEDELSTRTIEPYALVNGREGWYVASFDLGKEAVRHFRLDRLHTVEETGATFERRPEVDPAADIDGWPRTGELPASDVARVWIAPSRARWAREERRVSEELADGAVIVELPYAGNDWLVREVLAEAGDAAILSPVEARDAVHSAASALAAALR
ncbi:MAG: WYL domain-containing protein [Solirubrobacteraceae bacterium]|nr:WYL domain-containing protein [Solirubrobacteraceae bacterium]